MKIEKQTAVFMGNIQNGNDGASAAQQGKRKTIFGGGLKSVLDPVEKKRQEARQKAMKIVGDAWDGDKKLDQDVQERRDRISEYKKQLGDANKELKWFSQEREKLKEAYGVEEDSREEQELKLLEKEVDAGRGKAFLSMEEKQQLAALHKEGLTDYQSRSLNLYEESRYYDDMRIQAQDGITAETQAIEAIQLGRLKNQGMIKAQKSAKEVMEQASDEIVGMLMQEAKEHIDEEQEEKAEAAKEQKEKKEEEEEKLEKIKDEKEAREAFNDQIAESAEQMMNMESTVDDLQKELKKIMDEMKLMEEDLKGTAVDTVR